MGVAVRSIETVGHTTQLVDWITKVRCKKTNIRKQRRKNLLVEAVLSNALFRAELELRRKQQQRMQRWQQMKINWCSTNNSNTDSRKFMWDSSTCEELNSFDNFMSQLKNVKVSLER